MSCWCLNIGPMTTSLCLQLPSTAYSGLTRKGKASTPNVYRYMLVRMLMTTMMIISHFQYVPLHILVPRFFGQRFHFFSNLITQINRWSYLFLKHPQWPRYLFMYFIFTALCLLVKCQHPQMLQQIPTPPLTSWTPSWKSCWVSDKKFVPVLQVDVFGMIQYL